MEQRRGREFNGEVIIVGFCSTFVVEPWTGPDFGTGLVIGTDYDFGSDFVFIIDLGFGADFIIGTWLFIHFAYGFFDPGVIVFVGNHCGGK